MSIFHKLADLIRRIKLALRDMPSEVKELLDEVMPEVQKVKDLVESQLVRYAVAATPTIVDDLLASGISIFTTKLLKLYNCKTVQEWLNQTASMPEPDRNGRYHKIASLTVSDKLDVPEYISDSDVQTYYVAQNK